MGPDDLDTAERRWHSRSLFRRPRRSYGWAALLLLTLVAACVWLWMNPALLPSQATLMQLLPPVK